MSSRFGERQPTESSRSIFDRNTGLSLVVERFTDRRTMAVPRMPKITDCSLVISRWIIRCLRRLFLLTPAESQMTLCQTRLHCFSALKPIGRLKEQTGQSQKEDGLLARGLACK